MLYEFRFGNYRSFRDEAILSMGASEAVYLQFFKNEFRDVAVFRLYREIDFFESAIKKFKRAPALRDYTNEN